MAWLQNLAGRAEDLLNKIDKNAATVLNESVMKATEKENHTEVQVEANQGCIEYEKVKSNDGSNNVSPNSGVHVNENTHKTKRNIDDKAFDSNIPVVFDVVNEKRKSLPGSDYEYNMDKSVVSDLMSSASSVNNSVILAEDFDVLQDKVDSLTKENHHLSKELLNIKHQYSQLGNDTTNLRYQIESLTKQLSEAEKEKNIYIARAQRILHEKEQTVGLQQSSLNKDETENVYAAYNEELRNELDLERQRYEEVYKKNSILLSDMHSLQTQHQAIQSGLQATIHSLQMQLENEQRLRNYSDEDYREKNKAIVKREQEYAYQAKCLEQKDEEIRKLQEQLQKQIAADNREDNDEKIKSLTQTLMTKQHNLETITTERNALRLQIEKIQAEYQRVLTPVNRSQDKAVLIEDRDDSVPMPRFMRVSPFDASVTRRVKRAYSSLDAVSIRTGIFLRRYPVARVFVFCYMVLLHIWVLIILFLYAPSNR